MQNVVLVLLSVLILIVIAIVFVGYKKMSSLRVQISKLQLDVLSLRNFIDERILSSNPSMLGGFQPMMNVASSPINSLPNEEESNSTEQLTSEPVKEEAENSDSEYSYETVTDSEEDDEETEAQDEESDDEEKEEAEEDTEKDVEEDNDEEADEESDEDNNDEEADEDEEIDEEADEDEKIDEENVDEEVDLEDHEHMMSDELANKMFTAVQYLAAAQSLMHQEPMNVNTSNGTKEVHFEHVEQTVKVDTKPKRGRRVPNTKPNKLNVGVVQVSENDGNTYVVIENKNGVKRWAKYTGPPIEEAVGAPDSDIDVVKLPLNSATNSTEINNDSEGADVIILPETNELLRTNVENSAD